MAVNNQPGGVIVKAGTANKLTLWALTAVNAYTQVPGGSGASVAKAATTANIALTGAQTVDGVALIAGDFCLVKNQTTASQNGYYKVAAGTWVKQSPGQPTAVYVTSGTLAAKANFFLSAANTYIAAAGAYG
jgi:hypothetical protein